MQQGNASELFFDSFCRNPSLWEETKCQDFIRFAKTSNRAYMTETERLKLLEAGLSDGDVEELRVVFKWTKMIVSVTRMTAWD